jgi:hypothetical protein
VAWAQPRKGHRLAALAGPPICGTAGDMPYACQRTSRQLTVSSRSTVWSEVHSCVTQPRERRIARDIWPHFWRYFAMNPSCYLLHVVSFRAALFSVPSTDEGRSHPSASTTFLTARGSFSSIEARPSRAFAFTGLILVQSRGQVLVIEFGNALFIVLKPGATDPTIPCCRTFT